MLSHLPKWIEYSAFILALIAGYINAVGLISFEHQAVSHVSGTATLFGTSVLAGDWRSGVHLGGVLFAFFLGASVSGFLLNSESLKLGRHYDTALTLEAMLILLAFYLLTHDSYYGHFAASAACGLQNALATRYSGAVVRTTHLTGIFTDLGMMLGAVLRGEVFDRRKAILFLIIITGFISGGVLGALLFNTLQFKALLVPGGTCLLLAVMYRVYLKTSNRQPTH